MKVFSLAAISTAAIFSMVQYCPAPFAIALGPALGMTAAGATAADGVIASMAGGAIAGGIGKAPSRFRRMPIQLPDGIPQYNWDQCKDQLKGAHVSLKGLEPKVRVDGVPPACMNLATVIAGQPSQDGGPVPIPMGSDSLQYNDLSDDNLRQLGQNLKANQII
ncbi:hypothetical protein N7492_003445 [Penicillium capsulatum]|uniref:Uncharacterized protein n=1 Tax=Penicillium capsulatum TaxID=69766 RepID=A0A9W9LWK9_9EURO|nr:hypothetical protein N7492_003445 [Penicillium capsulatum]